MFLSNENFIFLRLRNRYMGICMGVYEQVCGCLQESQEGVELLEMELDATESHLIWMLGTEL